MSAIGRPEFERAFRQLLDAYASQDKNEDCVACEACKRCNESTFCRRSVGLTRCHYCVDCERCIDCTHCHGSIDLLSCNHSKACRRCSRSAYLEQCVDCSDCTYCFGCVGLSGREFHILNQPYDRTTYFNMTRELSRTLGSTMLR